MIGLFVPAAPQLHGCGGVIRRYLLTLAILAVGCPCSKKNGGQAHRTRKPAADKMQEWELASKTCRLYWLCSCPEESFSRMAGFSSLNDDFVVLSIIHAA